MKFRYDINFLRFIAVVAVVLYHFKVPAVSGGFIGVDIFFVISGYLMISIIVRRIENNSFSYLEFFKDRCKRIIPALLVVALFVTFLLSMASRLYPTYALVSSLFISNIYYYLHSDYFDLASQSNILLHTWSLSVEWQFYLIYPLLILLVLKLFGKQKNLYVIVNVLLIIISFGFMVYYNTTENNQAAFYFTHCRIWEMCIGGLIFLIEFKKGNVLHKISSVIKDVLCLTSYVVLALAIVKFQDKMVWPSYFTILPVVLTAIILLLRRENKIIKFPIFQFFGKVSYSLYLWHWPIWVIASLFLHPYLKSKELLSLLFVISTIIASLSYYLVESQKLWKGRVLVYIYIIIVLLSILFISTPISFILGLKIKREDKNEKREQFYTKTDEKEGCFINIWKYKLEGFNIEKCLSIDSTKKNILLIGDSHMAQFSKSIKENISGVNILEATANSSNFTLYDRNENKDIRKFVNYMYKDFIIKNQKYIDKVIISGFFSAFDEKYLIQDLKDEIAYFEDKGIEVKIIGQTPFYVNPYSEIAIIDYITRGYFDFEEEKAKKTNQKIKEELKSNYIDVYNLDIKKRNKEGDLFMYDKDHLSKYGSDQIIKQIIDQLEIK